MSDNEVVLRTVVEVTGVEQLQKVNKELANLGKSNVNATESTGKQSAALDKNTFSLKQMVPQLQAFNPLISQAGFGSLFAAGGFVGLAVAMASFGTQLPALEAQISTFGMTMGSYGGAIETAAESYNQLQELSLKNNITMGQTSSAMETLIAVTHNQANAETYLSEATEMHLATGKSVTDMAKLLADALNGNIAVYSATGERLQGVAAAQREYQLATAQGTAATKFFNFGLDQTKMLGEQALGALKVVGAGLLTIVISPLVLIEEVLKGLSDLFNSFPRWGSNISHALSNIGQGLSDFFSSAGAKMSSGFSDVGKAMDNIGSSLNTAGLSITGFLSTIGSKLVTGFGDIGAGAKVAWDKAVNVATWLMSGIMAGVNWLTSNGGTLISTAWTAICTGFKTAWNKAIDIVGWITDSIKTGATWLANEGISLLGKAWITTVQIFKNAWDDLVDVAKWITGSINNAVTWISNAGRMLIGAAWIDTCSVFKNVWDDLCNIKDWVVSAFNNAITWLENVGKSLWNNTLGRIFGTVGSASTTSSSTTPGYASGTDYAPGGMATVGENGPEQVYLPRGSQVVPNGGGAVNISVNISTLGSIPSSVINEITSSIFSEMQLRGIT
jgi:DNA-binding protein YbaB/predicted PurR-regulated permease PerM